MPRRKPGAEPKRIGRPAFEFDAKVLATIEQLAGYGLTLTQIGAVIGCCRKTIGQNEAAKEAAETGRAKAEGLIGKSLFERAKGGDVNAIRWWETTRAGRSEKATIAHQGGGEGAPPIKVEVRTDALSEDKRASAVAALLDRRREAADGQTAGGAAGPLASP